MVKTEFNDRMIDLLCREFLINGDYRGYEQMTYGHINTTFKVNYSDNGEINTYILQRINTYVFKNPEMIMQNVVAVTEFIREKVTKTGESARRSVLHYQHTADGKYYINDKNGDFWRCYRFIEDSVAVNFTEDLGIIEESGRAFGEFQLHLSDYPAEKLYIVIPHFHNTVNRYELFKQAIARDAAGRKKAVEKDIEEYLALEDSATRMYKMQRRGELPLRVTHNDTKSNNVLFDENTMKHLAVIDLDTVMPGLVGFDFGDAIRFVANTCAEDEKDVSKVKLDENKFRAFTKGFVQTVGKRLTEAEKNTLSLGAATMAAECGMRFLTDYLDGDKYFGTSYKGHNLVRARCQLALAKDMMRRLDEMQGIVAEYI